MTALALPLREEPALGRAAALSALVHGVLFVVVVLGVRWQSHRPDVVEVELWEPPPPRAAPEIRPEPPPPAPPKVEPAPPPVPKPQIAIREKPKPKPEPKAKPKPEAKKAPVKPKPDPALQKLLQAQAAQEQKALEAQQRERALKDLLARAQVDSRSKGIAEWQDKIRAKIRGNILMPQNITGNPEAIFDVTQLPTGEILTVTRRKSSGHAGYDEAVERAILKSSPLPKPDNPGIFTRQLELHFHPQD